MRTRLLAALALALAALTLTAPAADWPQWRGPKRDGISAETGLLKEWPKDGPALVWKSSDVLGGYSTPSVVGDRIYTIGNKDQDEFGIALGVKDGKEVWKTRIGAVGKNTGPNYPGSRATPAVDGDHVYCLGSDGDLVCLTAAKGEVVWKKSYRKDFGGAPNKWAYSESPLVDADVLVCTPGGTSATLLALNKKSGEVIWKSPLKKIDKAANASVIAATVGGKKLYVAFVGEGVDAKGTGGVVGVDAKTGAELWRYTKTSDADANIMTPLFHDDAVFNAASRVGSALLKLKADGDGVKAEEVYFNPNLRFGSGGVVVVDGHLYGVSGFGPQAQLTCIEFATGKVKWQNKSVGPASIVYADGLLFLRGEETEIALAEASPEGYREKGRFKQPDRARGNQKAWQHPVLSNGKMYVRDQNVLLCYDVKGK
jgi:outer membrane protein assembly factor BamB